MVSKASRVSKIQAVAPHHSKILAWAVQCRITAANSTREGAPVNPARPVVSKEVTRRLRCGKCGSGFRTSCVVTTWMASGASAVANHGVCQDG